VRYAALVRAVVLDPPSAGLEELLERRRRSGLDRLDEVWEGVLHMVPAPGFAHALITQQLAVILDAPGRVAGLIPTMGEFNLGQDERDFRVPDGGLHRPGARGTWLATAALVVEIVSPGDETWEKLPFYAAHDVDELLIVDPEKRSVDWLARTGGVARTGGEYRPIQRSGLIELGPSELRERIDWPNE
jgi:Uma2 family endonuclease